MFILINACLCSIHAWFMHPFKKGSMLFCTSWSVGMSVCRPSYIRLNTVCPAKLGKVDAPREYMFSIVFKSKVKSNCWSLYKWNPPTILRPFYSKVDKLGTVIPVQSWWPLIMFRSHGQRSRSNYTSLKNIVHSISLEPLLESKPHLVQWMPLESRWSLLIIWSQCERWRSNCS